MCTEYVGQNATTKGPNVEATRPTAALGGLGLVMKGAVSCQVVFAVSTLGRVPHLHFLLVIFQ